MALRYVAPNLVTSLAMLLGMLAVVMAMDGSHVAAAWLVVWSTFLDRADGVVARALKATSGFGVQMDSFADFFNFGVVPAFIVFTALASAPGLPFAAGAGHAALMAVAAAWILACTYRLARFNVITDEPRYRGLFFGIPTTLAAGTLMTWFLTLMKYAAADNPLGARAAFTDPRLLGDLAVPAAGWSAFLGGMVFLAVLMVSNLRVRKPSLGRTPAGIALAVLSIAGLACAALRALPEYMITIPTGFILIWLSRQLSPELRAIEAPPFIPGRTGA